MGFDVNGTVALVTGANRGIGKAIVESLLQHGAAKVYAAVRNPDSMAEMADASEGRVVPVKLDLTDRATIEAAADTARDVRLVINNGGVLRTATALSDDAIDALRFEIETNVVGLLHMAQAFAPVLKANGGGAFAQLNSVASMTSFPAFTTYCASKAAAYSITQSLRQQLGDQGISVHSVHPGPIDTDMGDAAGFHDIGEPPSIVAEALIAGLQAGEFHIFPDAMAQQIGEAYQPFAKQVIEKDAAEG